MNVIQYARHIPQIEAWLSELRPDALICGLGPTGWLLPWIDQKLLQGVRLFGSHDGCRLMPMDDLIIMDANCRALSNETARYEGIVSARPKRIWTYHKIHGNWLANLPECLHSITTKTVWEPFRGHIDKKGQPIIVTEKTDEKGRILSRESSPFMLVHEPLHTGLVAPTGMTTLAWKLGCRRIGVIGVDMIAGHFPNWKSAPAVDIFFRRMAEQAYELGGAIRNLSPVTALKKFAAWQLPTPSASVSVPTSGSTTQEPNSSSNTASASTPPTQSSSSGCEQGIQNGPSARTEIPSEVGSSAVPSI